MQGDRSARTRQPASTAGRTDEHVSTRTRWVFAGVVGLLAMSGFAYIPVFRAGFMWDDDVYVIPIESLRTMEGLRRIWLEPAILKQYYPLCYTSFWIENQFWELNPRGYHVVNVGLHAVNAVLVWLLLRRLELPGAWVAAAVFALHPVHVETVAWITERRNTLSALFYLLAMLAYLRFRPLKPAEMGRRGRWIFYALALLAFLAALLSKTVTCTLPAAILLLIWWKHRRITARDVASLIPFFLAGVGLSWITFKLESGLIAGSVADIHYTAWQHVLIAGRTAWFYLGQLLLPINLIHVYPRWIIDPHVAWQYLYPAGVLVLLGVLWHLRRRIGYGPLVGVLFFGGTLLPNLGLIDFAFMDRTLVADRFEYLPSLGIIALVVGLAAAGLRRAGPPTLHLAPVLSVVVLAALGLGVWQRALIFQTSETLWRATLEKNPDCAVAHYNLSCDLLERQQAAEALPHLEAAVRLQPNYLRAINDLASVYATAGRYEDALRALTQSAKLSPYDEGTHANLGLMCMLLHRYDEAAAHCRQALAINPNFGPARDNLNALTRMRAQTPASAP